MTSPPGNPLFFGTIAHDALGPAGVTMHSQRHFTEVHLQDYHPLHSIFNYHTRQQVIQAHYRLRRLFRLDPIDAALRWPWQLKSATDTCKLIP